MLKKTRERVGQIVLPRCTCICVDQSEGKGVRAHRGGVGGAIKKSRFLRTLRIDSF